MSYTVYEDIWGVHGYLYMWTKYQLILSVSYCRCFEYVNNVLYTFRNSVVVKYKMKYHSCRSIKKWMRNGLWLWLTTKRNELKFFWSLVKCYSMRVPKCLMEDNSHSMEIILIIYLYIFIWKNEMKFSVLVFLLSIYTHHWIYK